MAGEIQLDYGESGKTLYALILNASGQIWNGSTFEAINAANWATYAIAMAEQSTTGIYTANFPAVAAGSYGVTMRLRVGVSPATTDQAVATVNSPVHWDGSAEILSASRAEYTAAKAAYLDASIAAVKAKTDNLPSDPADDSDIDAQLAAIAAYIDTEVAAIKAKTDNLPASPAATGSAMTLADNAITAAKIATGAVDADALAADAVAELADGIWDEAQSGHVAAGTFGKYLDAQVSSRQTLGAGAITFTYTLTDSATGNPIADADVWATTDAAGTNVVARGTTNSSGQIAFYLDAGTIYIWRAKDGWAFANPDSETVA